MSVLVDWQIKELQITKNLISPYFEENVQPNSYDLTLGNSFYMSIPGDVDPQDQISFIGSYIPFESDEFKIRPKQFVLGSTIEYINLPANVVAQLNGVSSAARLGISNHQTGGWIDAGFRGNITLELYNCSRSIVTLRRGMRIGQLVFHRTEMPSRAYNGKYQGQRGATLSKMHMDKK